MSGAVRVAELESLFTADIKPFEQAAVKVETRRKDLTKAPTEVKVDADTKGAVAGMDRVEAQAKRITSKDVVAQVDADIAKAAGKVLEIGRELDVLRRMDASPQVDADIAKAESKLSQAGARLRALQGMRAEMVVEADTSKAERDLDGFQGHAEGSGSSAGKAFLGGLIGGLASTPIVGALVGLGQDLADAFMSGFEVEQRSDRLEAMTGLDPVTVAKLARVSGEAFANNWGESIAANMDTARLAVQTQLLNPKSTARDAQAVIESLSGVADVLGEEIPRVARSTAQLLRTGLAKDTQQAFDIIVKGQQAGLNVSEDWLDTLDEYSTQWRKLGLNGEQVLGLLSQGVRAGARDTDIAADALKEFSIRAVDGSETTKAGFDAIGLSAKDMAEQIGRGGPEAAAALDLTLDRLRAIEDPARRAQVAVMLFGTQAEDMGDALYAMDLSNAVEQLGQVEGAAAKALGVMGDNAAGDIATAQRNIEVAADGIKGALAAAFNPQIEDFSTWVSGNREAVMQFLLDIANGGLDAGRAFVEFAASSTEAIGDFISGPLANLASGIADILDGMSFAGLGIPGAQEAAGDLRGFVDTMEGVKDATDAVAENMRTNLIQNGIDPVQDKLNDIAIPMIAEAGLHDATVRLASDIDGLGAAADGTQASFQGLDLANLTATDSGKLLDEQLRTIAASMDEQVVKGLAAGQTQQQLTDTYNVSRDALLNQLTAMGLTTDQAQAMIDKYGMIPSRVDTVIAAETGNAQADVDHFITYNTGRGIKLTVYTDSRGFTPYVQWNNARGNILRAEAAGDLLTAATPMSPIAQVVPPGTLRVVGDRLDVDEAYIPIDRSPRSMAILAETMSRMGVAPMAGGGVMAGASSTSTGGGDVHIGTLSLNASDVREFVELADFAGSLVRLAKAKGGVRG